MTKLRYRVSHCESGMSSLRHSHLIIFPQLFDGIFECTRDESTTVRREQRWMEIQPTLLTVLPHLLALDDRR